MKLYKYQGAGNDFVVAAVSGRDTEIPSGWIVRVCDRRLGIGADGLIAISESDTCAFSMRYWNSDGSSGMMCGNGGRCAVDFAKRMGILPNPGEGDPEGTYVFEAPDGIHKGRILKEPDAYRAVVELQMNDVDKVERLEPDENEDALPLSWKMNTGAEHLVIFREDISNLDVDAEGSRWRYDRRFAPKGTNVDFVKVEDRNHIIVRTYEKGVEAETLSCGTGVIASAIAAYLRGDCDDDCTIRTTMNTFRVTFRQDGNAFRDIALTGDTELVFTAEYPSDRIF